MESSDSELLFGAEIHGFHTAADLDIDKLMKDASARWFRPNEVHAMLSNYTLFKVQPQPLDRPPNGSVLLFDRKMLRGFRKDGHNWKKKKDGKTVQEAHEKLKIGTEERIHVYYARSEDDSSFYRRCYWLLDKNLERIVLVHYRQMSEENILQQQPAPIEGTEASPFKNDTQYGSPSTLVNSVAASAQSETSGTEVFKEEINSGYINFSVADAELQKHELRLREINTLDWAALVVSPALNDSPRNKYGETVSHKQMQNGLRTSMENDGLLLYADAGRSSQYSTDFANDSIGCEVDQIVGGYYQAEKGQDISSPYFATVDRRDQVAEISLDDMGGTRSTDIVTDDVLSEDNFAGWNYANDDSFGLLGDLNRAAQKRSDQLDRSRGVKGKGIGRDGEDAGADEGGGVRSVAVPAEGDERSVEGHSRQDPPQGHRELAIYCPPSRPARRNLLLCAVLPGKGEDGTQILIIMGYLFPIL